MPAPPPHPHHPHQGITDANVSVVLRSCLMHSRWKAQVRQIAANSVPQQLSKHLSKLHAALAGATLVALEVCSGARSETVSMARGFDAAEALRAASCPCLNSRKTQLRGSPFPRVDLNARRHCLSWTLPMSCRCLPGVPRPRGMVNCSLGGL